MERVSTLKGHRLTSLGGPRRWRVLATACATLAALLAAATPAPAEFGLSEFDAQLLDSSDQPITRAGTYPDRLVTSFTVNQVPGPQFPVPEEKLKNVVVELPPGLAGSALGAPVCSDHDFAFGAPDCPAATQVGEAVLNLSLAAQPMPLTLPVYNLPPGPSRAARFGFLVAVAPVNLLTTVRGESDYGLTSTIPGINQVASLYGSTVTLWGVPADRNGGGAERAWLLRTPTSCDRPLEVRLRVNSWEDPDDVKTYTKSLAPMTGCDDLAFEPSVSVAPHDPRAGVPSGYDVNIQLPQSSDPAAPVTADLRDATVTLPEGVALSPSAGAGLAACTDAQFGAGTAAAMSCPAAARVGSVTVDTPALAEPLEGGLFLGEPQPGQTFRLFLHAERSGVVLRLKGSVRPDPATGRLVTRFENSPQLPFSDLRLRFFGGARAVLANPTTCGTKTAAAELVSHAGQTRTVTDAFAITQAAGGGPCAAALPFAPAFSAGSANPVAGAFSPFVMRVAREDGQQELGSLSVALPAGFSAKVAGVPLCPEANALAGSCPAESRMGSVTVGVGAGPGPVDVPGTAYLAGPYKRAPYSLVFVVPARVGPIDLGLVVVRAAVHVDPTDAHLTVASDPLPAIVGGVPLRMRSLTVTIDRPGTTVNPTSCAPKTVRATVQSVGGAVAAPESRFQVGDCAALRFSPRLRATFTGGRRQLRRRGGHPGLRVHLTQPPGQANLRSVAFRLPRGLSLDLETLPTPCTAAQLAALACPEESLVGSARAVTTLLSEPLSGPVHLVAGEGSALPALTAILRGQVTIVLRGQTSFGRRGLTNRFPAIPDVPITDFRLRIAGGRDGILTRGRRSLCGRRPAAGLRMRAQNGRLRARTVRVTARCRARPRR